MTSTQTARFGQEGGGAGGSVVASTDHCETIPIDEVRPGDLLFFARPSLIQWLGAIAADEFRGVAIADRQDGQLIMVQCGYANGFEVRVLADIVDDFEVIGVGRAPDCDCVNDVLAWARGRLGETNHYPVVSVIPAGLLSWARNARSPVQTKLRRLLVVGPFAALGLLLSAGARRRSPHRTFICSTFLAEALTHGCWKHRTVVVMARHKAAVSPHDTPLDRLLERWYLTPSDIWRSLPAEHRFLLDLGVAVEGAVDDPDRTQGTPR